MKLQLALDDITLEDALTLLKSLESSIDIVEVGTPFMMAYGMKAVRQIKSGFPHIELLCDAKIMDAGSFEAQLTFDAGADYVTVLGVTDDLTIQDVVRTAHDLGRKVMVDMICVNDIESRVKTLETLGVDVIAVHTGVDQQAAGRTPLEDLAHLRAIVKKTEIAVAGGISLETLKQYAEYEPEIIIVGGGILGAEDPSKAAHDIKQVLKGYSV